MQYQLSCLPTEDPAVGRSEGLGDPRLIFGRNLSNDCLCLRINNIHNQTIALLVDPENQVALEILHKIAHLTNSCLALLKRRLSGDAPLLFARQILAAGGGPKQPPRWALLYLRRLLHRFHLLGAHRFLRSRQVVCFRILRVSSGIR